MITYRKKSLKVKNLFATSPRVNEKYSHAIARQLQEFIEKGEHSRIADILIYKGTTDRTLVCSIIYETPNQNPKTR